jgi:hypothetical protein
MIRETMGFHQMENGMCNMKTCTVCSDMPTPELIPGNN